MHSPKTHQSSNAVFTLMRYANTRSMKGAAPRIVIHCRSAPCTAGTGGHRRRPVNKGPAVSAIWWSGLECREWPLRQVDGDGDRLDVLRHHAGEPLFEIATDGI